MAVRVQFAGCANVAWAFATILSSDLPLFAAMARIAKQHVSDFKSQDFANVAWAFVTAGPSKSLEQLAV